MHPGVDRATLSNALRQEFSAIAGTNITIGQPIGHRIDHLLSGTRANIAVKIFGPDLRRLRELGTQVRDALQPIPGLVDLQLEQQSDVPELRIEADRGALGRHGLAAADLAETIDVALGGEQVGEILEEGRRTALVVRADEPLRADPTAIGQLVMEALRGADAVAYVRFASVYRDFREAADFQDVLGEIAGTVETDATPAANKPAALPRKH